MSKPVTRSNSTSEASVGVATANVDIEKMVKAACQKAVEVLKDELLKMFSDITARLDSVEKRLTVMEQKSADFEVGLNDLSGRVMELQCTTDGLAAGGNPDVIQDRFSECMIEINAIKAETRTAICTANDAEQYGRRNNIRIRGLPTSDEDDCRAVAKSFLNEKLQVNVSSEDIEAAHILPMKAELNTKKTVCHTNNFINEMSDHHRAVPES